MRQKCNKKISLEFDPKVTMIINTIFLNFLCMGENGKVDDIMSLEYYALVFRAMICLITGLCFS